MFHLWSIYNGSIANILSPFLNTISDEIDIFSHQYSHTFRRSLWKILQEHFALTDSVPICLDASVLYSSCRQLFTSNAVFSTIWVSTFCRKAQRHDFFNVFWNGDGCECYICMTARFLTMYNSLYHFLTMIYATVDFPNVFNGVLENLS